MGRKKKPEEHENHERWMVSYADFVTLLFAFFTCLYAISTVDAVKMGQMVASVRASFSGGDVFNLGSSTLTLFDGDGGAATVSNMSLISNDMGSDGDSRRGQAASRQVLEGDAAMGRFRRTLEAMLSEEIKSGTVRVYQERRGVVVSIGENGIFDSGSVDIRPDGIVTLDTIATAFTSVGNQIRIEGHTDNIPINTFRFPSNWELSTGRAGTVLRRMETVYGMPSDLLVASGYGEQRPVATNETSEGRARNRRVDIVILNPSVARAEPL